MPSPCPSHTPAMPARHSDVRRRDVSSRLLGSGAGWDATVGMAAEADGLRPEAAKLASSSTSSGYAGREISSPPPTVPAPAPRSRLPLGIGPAVGTALPRGGEGHQGLPCLSACVLPSSTLPSPNASILPCVHSVTCQLLRCPFPIPSMNPGCFLSPSVFRTRTHVLVLVLAALSSFLGPDVSCRPHIVTDATLCTAAELLKGQESR
jgi:hypothetical protein